MLTNHSLLVNDEIILRYKNANPFPHLLVDNFIKEDVIQKVNDELRNLPEEVWNKKRDPLSKDMEVQKKKLSIADCKGVGENTEKLIDFFNSSEFISYLEQLTGITDLICDPTLLGGGVHRVDKGGKLSIHADFNIHPGTGLHRRLNVLLYMNKDYKDEFQGKLELWNKNMTECIQKIAPLFNRMILFKITDDAFHGHPEIWNSEEFRLSLAFYYYTKDRPEEEKSSFHWANWQLRPNLGY
jgi:Rps23 Pro-64 3,4-dihydroxylase Tpa1-like proline 4-hydroxylase